MEATRVERAGRPVRREVPLLPPLERLALVVLVLGRQRAAGLLEGLRETEAGEAREHLERLAALPSAQRQARVAVEFGVRPEAAARLRALMAELPEVLRREVFRRLPAYHRSLFPEREEEQTAEATPPRAGEWAERLVREATR
jgi:hypothetical protein